MNNQPLRKRDYPLIWLMLGVSRLPFPILYLLSDFLGFIAYRLLGYRKKVVVQNLQRAFPEKSASEIKTLTKAFYRNLCDVVVETIKLATIRPEALLERVRFPGADQMEAHVASGTSIIVMGSHQANWEWALSGAALSLTFPVAGVYKPLASHFFDRFMRELRSRLGPSLIPMKDTLRNLLRNQKNLRAVSVLSDQIPPRGEIQYWTRFLNQDTAFYVGADKLAASFKYPVYFMGVRRLKRGYYEYSLELLYDGLAPLPADTFPITEAYARHLEKWIQAYPADYLWSHKRWKHQKPVSEPAPEIKAG